MERSEYPEKSKYNWNIKRIDFPQNVRNVNFSGSCASIWLIHEANVSAMIIFFASPTINLSNPSENNFDSIERFCNCLEKSFHKTTGPEIIFGKKRIYKDASIKLPALHSLLYISTKYEIEEKNTNDRPIGTISFWISKFASKVYNKPQI